MLAKSLVRAASTSASASASAATGSAGPSSSTLSAYLLLSRPPTVLRSPTPFESTYHAYNSKLQQALSQPFPRDLYFKKGSANETKFLQEEKARKIAARGEREDVKGKQNAASTSKQQEEVAARIEESNEALYQTVSRRTKADEEGRTDTLERSLDRHLFLMVKAPEMGNEWTIPFAKMYKNGPESLHKAAPEAVHKLLGKELDIWMVTNLPVGVVSNSANDGEKGYVMRGHILSGQPSASSKGVEFAWLTREEIQDRISEEQWQGIEDLLST